MKTLKTLTALGACFALGALVPASASAAVSTPSWQCQLRSAAATGDTYPDRYGWTADQGMLNAWVLGPFGMSASKWNRNFKDTACTASSFASFGDVDCASRRMMNALTVLEDVAVTGKSYTWNDWTSAHVDSLAPSTQCANLWGVNNQEWNGQLSSDAVDSNISLMKVTIFSMNVVDRAALLVHEARHDDKPHDANGQCSSTGTSCDSSFGYGGSNAYQVKFYEDALTSWKVSLTPAQRAESLQAANFVLNGFFAVHPGFNLAEEDTGIAPGYGDAEQVKWTWSSGSVQAAYFPNPAGPTDAITGVGLAMSGGAVVHLRVCWRTVSVNAAGTSLGGQQCASFGRNTGAPLDMQVSVPTGRVLSRLKVATAGGKVVRMCAYSRWLTNGVPTGGTSYACQGPATTTYDVDLEAADGHFMTGLGFGASSGKIKGWAMSQTLGPDFEDLSGTLGGSGTVLACPAGQVPVGLLANQVWSSKWSTNVVGTLGLLCADAAWLTATSMSQVDVSTVNVARSSYYDPAAGVWYPAGTVPLYEKTRSGLKLGPHPTNVKIKYCAVGSELRGLEVRAGQAVDAIDDLLCTSFKDVPVGVGGPGGVTTRQDCVFPPGVATYSTKKAAAGIYVRSGWYLDGLAMRCAL